ncbi:hypothetical protein MTO96_007734 [Rhipicephalus appendiculatus]
MRQAVHPTRCARTGDRRIRLALHNDDARLSSSSSSRPRGAVFFQSRGRRRRQRSAGGSPKIGVAHQPLSPRRPCPFTHAAVPEKSLQGRAIKTTQEAAAGTLFERAV